MKPLKHFVIGLVISFSLYFFQITSLLSSLLVLATNSLIDSDHYFYYVYYKRDLSFRNAYNWFVKEPKSARVSILVFHGVEFLIALVLLSLFFPLLWAVIFGVIVHFSCDIIDEKRRKLFLKNIVTTKR